MPFAAQNPVFLTPGIGKVSTIRYLILPQNCNSLDQFAAVGTQNECLFFFFNPRIVRAKQFKYRFFTGKLAPGYGYDGLDLTFFYTAITEAKAGISS